jgi:hypothetical protein
MNEPAFPCTTKINTSSDPFATPKEKIFPGMTLRDYFAGQALTSIISCPEFRIALEKIGKEKGLTIEESITRAAFVYADSMIRNRK